MRSTEALRRAARSSLRGGGRRAGARRSVYCAALDAIPRRACWVPLPLCRAIVIYQLN
jgi:hypothetical protein